MAGTGSLSRVLLVEDNPADEALVRSLIPQEVDCVEGIVSARQILAKREYQCILTDLHVVDSRGVATVREMVSIAKGIPVIALTAREPDVGADVLEAGAQDFMAKDGLDEQGLARAMAFAVRRVKRDKMRLRMADLISKDLDEPLMLMRGDVDELLGTPVSKSQERALYALRRALERQAEVIAELKGLVQR